MFVEQGFPALPVAPAQAARRNPPYTQEISEKSLAATPFLLHTKGLLPNSVEQIENWYIGFQGRSVR